jgi:aspartyl-tRNA(Asn)/glutamyl-tRNA(Gln) amidotransferase subunit C
MLAFAMAEEFTAAQVAAIAALAQLELEPDEIQLFTRQLGEFLGYADEVLAIDTAGVAPTAYVVTRQESERADRVCPSLERDTVLRSAPDPSLDTGFFRVPRVIG